MGRENIMGSMVSSKYFFMSCIEGLFAPKRSQLCVSRNMPMTMTIMFMVIFVSVFVRCVNVWFSWVGSKMNQPKL